MRLVRFATYGAAIARLRNHHSKRSSRIASRGRTLLLIMATLATCGCAIKYHDARGRSHVLGFVHIVGQEPTPESGMLRQVMVENIGAAVFATPANRGIAIGFNRESVVFAQTMVQAAPTPASLPSTQP